MERSLHTLVPLWILFYPKSPKGPKQLLSLVFNRAPLLLPCCDFLKLYQDVVEGHGGVPSSVAAGDPTALSIIWLPISSFCLYPISHCLPSSEKISSPFCWGWRLHSAAMTSLNKSFPIKQPSPFLNMWRKTTLLESFHWLRVHLRVWKVPFWNPQLAT